MSDVWIKEQVGGRWVGIEGTKRKEEDVRQERRVDARKTDEAPIDAVLTSRT